MPATNSLLLMTSPWPGYMGCCACMRAAAAAHASSQPSKPTASSTPCSIAPLTSLSRYNATWHDATNCVVLCVWAGQCNACMHACMCGVGWGAPCTAAICRAVRRRAHTTDRHTRRRRTCPVQRPTLCLWSSWTDSFSFLSSSSSSSSSSSLFFVCLPLSTPRYHHHQLCIHISSLPLLLSFLLHLLDITQHGDRRPSGPAARESTPWRTAQARTRTLTSCRTRPTRTWSPQSTPRATPRSRRCGRAEEEKKEKDDNDDDAKKGRGRVKTSIGKKRGEKRGEGEGKRRKKKKKEEGGGGEEEG